jgi:alpha-L-rhamnosidase
MGATTMWEAWQAILPDGTPTSVSYNHYAFGCVGDWIYRNVAGIEAKTPGYKVSLFKPEMDARLTSAKGSYNSVYGRLVSDWEIRGGKMTYKVTVPANTTAEIMMPYANIADISEGGKPLSEAKGIVGVQKSGEKIIVTTGSGSYLFTYAIEGTEVIS